MPKQSPARTGNPLWRRLDAIDQTISNINFAAQAIRAVADIRTGDGSANEACMEMLHGHDLECLLTLFAERIQGLANDAAAQLNQLMQEVHHAH